MASQIQNFALKANVLANSYYVDLVLRYWYEGEEVHSVPMIAGSDTIIPWSEFPHDADKILNVEVVVTPGDPAIGPAKVYSFIWYPGNAALQYVHPAIGTLSATAADGALSLSPDVIYTKTDYTLDVGTNTSINLAGSQLQKYTNKTNNTQDNSDTVIVKRMKEGVALDEGTTVLPLTADKYPVGSWTLDNLDISEADALQIEVISYVDSKYSRTYNITLEKTAVHEHSVIAIEAVAATCTEAGLTEGSKCSECEETLVEQEVVPALGHDFGEWTVATAPTYEAEGLKTRACSRCDETEEATIAMLQPVVITKQPEDYVGNDHDTVLVSVEAEGDGLQYQWYYSKNQGETWIQSYQEGAKNASMELLLTSGRVGQMYKCVIVDSGNNTVTSEPMTISLKAPDVAIVSQPQDYAGNIGDTAVFTIDCTGEALTYQWNYSKDGEKWVVSGLEGNKTNTLKVPVINARFGYQYQCVITDAQGNKLTSDAVTLTKKVADDIVIVSQPESVSDGVLNQVYTFAVEATGEELTYQWYYSKDGGETWWKSGMTGATTNALSVKLTNARSGQMYRCVITNAKGDNLTSEAATLSK